MVPPLYNVNDLICIAESAALGFLEQYRVSTVTNQGIEWIYTIKWGIPKPYERTALFGEMISGQEQFLRYFRESELMPYCDAVDLIVQVLQRRLYEAQRIQASLCPTPSSNPTANPTATY
jgi:hypothetical protein